MPRKPRIHVPGGFYHVMLRGNGGQKIFLDPEDGRIFLDILADAARRYGLRVHAWCLMPNHLHLLLQVGAEPLSRAMQSIGQRYTARIHGRERRSGHLFQGRYKAVLVDADSYLLELVRYLHLNPVRAGLATRPEAWRWSSHRAYLGMEAAPMLTTDTVLGRFGKDVNKARRALTDFVLEGVGREAPPHLAALDAGGPAILGDESFATAALEKARADEAMRENAPPVDAIVAAVCEAWGVKPKDLSEPSRARDLSEARAAAALLARETGAASLTEMATRFRRELSSLSRVVQNLEARAAGDAELEARMAAASRSLGVRL